MKCKNCGKEVIELKTGFVRCEDCGWFFVDESGQWIPKKQPEIEQEQEQPKIETQPEQTTEPEIVQVDVKKKSYIPAIVAFGAIVAIILLEFVWKKKKSQSGLPLQGS